MRALVSTAVDADPTTDHASMAVVADSMTGRASMAAVVGSTLVPLGAVMAREVVASRPSGSD